MSDRIMFFDIDGTMITTGGVGQAAMVQAGRDLYGPSFSADGVSFAGRLDPLLLEELLSRNGCPVTAESVERLFEQYSARLEARLKEPIRGGPLPGVLSLLDALESEGAVLGLLTGNYGATGSMKLRACGIDPDRFHIHVWGCDSPHTPPSRDHLPAVGLERFQRRFGRTIHPGAATIIGDTPHDIACARAGGCRSLGVATGRFSVAELAGADRAVPDLSDTESLVRWLLDRG